MNSDKRMAELYLERAAGKKHLAASCFGGWVDKHCGPFSVDIEYKLKPETLEDFINYMKVTDNGYEEDLITAVKWAWANPESKDEYNG